MATSQDKYINRIKNNYQKKKNQKKRLLTGSGPLAKFMIYIIQVIFIDSLKFLYNHFVNILTDCFNFVQEQFFSDFKGFLAGKLTSKKGTCIEYTFFRYFMTLMLPPMGVFLSRGISAWFNILLCGLLCFIKYFPGLIYAIIIIQKAPYAERYKEMKRAKLAKKKPQKPLSDIEISYTPLLVFIGAVLISCFAIYLSIKSNPFQKVIGDPFNMVENAYNKYFNSGEHSLKNVLSHEVKNQIHSNIRNKIINQLK